MQARYSGMSVPDALKDVCEVGKYSYADGGSPNIVLTNAPYEKLVIGSFVSIGPKCNIFLGSEHHTNFVSTFNFSKWFVDGGHIDGVKTKGSVIIGSDVWIGAYATILSGVTIGHGAVIGANAVVAKNVEPYTIVVGNPIREIRKRFDDDIIEQLLRIKWWEWSDEEIGLAIPYLMSNDVGEFIVYASNRRG